MNGKPKGIGTYVVLAIIAFFFLSAFPVLTALLGLGALAWYLLFRKGGVTNNDNLMNNASFFGKLSVLAIVLVVVAVVIIRFIVIIPRGKLVFTSFSDPSLPKRTIAEFISSIPWGQ